MLDFVNTEMETLKGTTVPVETCKMIDKDIMLKPFQWI